MHEAQRRHLRKDDRAVGDLQESDVWLRYAKGISAEAGKIRVFAMPELSDSLEMAISLEKGLEFLERAIAEAAQ